MYIVNLGSSSSGNSTLVFSESGDCIVIDAGIIKKRIMTYLNSVEYPFDRINALFITHSHDDHTRQQGIFPPNKTYQTFPVKLKALNKSAMNPAVIKQLEEEEDETVNQVTVFKPYSVFEIGSFKVSSVPMNHDAYNTVAYIIEADEEKLVLITDTGYIQEDSYSLFKNPDYLMIESNHDETLLLNSNREFYLKKRILSDKGHLSNTQCAYYITQLIGKKTKEIMLLHLSEECNTEELAIQAYKDVTTEILLEVPKAKLNISKKTEVTTMGTKPSYLKEGKSITSTKTKK